MFDNFVNDVLVPVLYTVAMTIIPVVAGYVIDALRKWAAKQKAEWFRAIIDEAAVAASRAVAAVEQTYVSHMRNESGGLDHSAAKEAFAMAVIESRKQLGKEAMKALARVLGGPDAADEALGTMVEAAVGRAKTEVRSSDEFLGR